MNSLAMSVMRYVRIISIMLGMSPYLAGHTRIFDVSLMSLVVADAVDGMLFQVILGLFFTFKAKHLGHVGDYKIDNEGDNCEVYECGEKFSI